MVALTQRYAAQICGVLSCYDRIVVTGNLLGLAHADGMASYLRSQNIRLFDYPRFAEPLRDEFRDNSERLAKDNGLQIEFIRTKASFRKVGRVQEILSKRGVQPGLV